VIGVIGNLGVTAIGRAAVDSKGWLKGGIVDREAAARCIAEAAETASAQTAGETVTKATFGIGGWAVSSVTDSAVVELERYGYATDDDLEKMRLQIVNRQTTNQRSVVSIMPHRWLADGEPADPFLRQCFFGGVEALVITVPLSQWQELKSVIELSGIQMENVDFEPVAAMRDTLTGIEANEGALIIDIGAQSSGVAVWQGGKLTWAEGGFWGADQMLRDVAFSLDLPMRETYRLSRLAASSKKKAKMDHRIAVANALTRTCFDVATNWRQQLEEHGFSPLEIPGQIVLVGGGASQEGMIHAFKEVFRRPVRLVGQWEAPVIGAKPKVPDADLLLLESKDSKLIREFLPYTAHTSTNAVEDMWEWATAFGLMLRSAGQQMAGSGGSFGSPPPDEGKVRPWDVQ
jgi:cell division protein FtsA